jgi:hypothetical protein
METITHGLQLETYKGMDLEQNYGSYNSYASPDGMKAVVVDWRTGKPVKRFTGETAHQDAERWAWDLHYAHDH